MKFVRLAYLAAAVCLLASGLRLAAQVCEFAVPGHLSAWRAAARQAPGEHVGILADDPENPTPVERSRLIAVAWEIAPRRVQLTAADEGMATLVHSSFAPPAVRARLEDLGYRPLVSNEYATVWTRRSLPPPPAVDCIPERWREMLAIGVVLALLAGSWGWFNRRLARPCDGTSVLAAFAVFLVLSTVAITHPLLPPNGLGVYGGKAKLCYLAHGIPVGFWTARAFAVFQPAYPPGQALLTLAVNLLAGGCGEWLVQLLVPAALALLFLELTETTSRPTWLVGLLLVCSPVAIGFAVGYYAEPLAALCLVCGLHAIRRGYRIGGAVLAGCAGWFRPEGGLLAVGFVAVSQVRLLYHWRVALTLAAAALPALAWQLVCIQVGANIQDVQLMEAPSAARSLAFARELLRLLVFAWASGSVSLLFLKPGRRMWLALSGGLLILVTFAVLAGFDRSPHFAWITETYAPRLVWMVLVGVCACTQEGTRWTTC